MQQRTIVPQVLYSLHQPGCVANQEIQVTVHQGDLCLNDYGKGGRLHRCKVYYGLLLTLSDPVCHCLLQLNGRCSFTTVQKGERKLYSANKLLTLNYSLSSVAESLLPQFSVLHRKHKISYPSSKPFLIEIGDMDAVRFVR